MDYTCGCQRCKGCKVGIRWQTQVFIQRENGGWEGIVMWDKGVCLPHAITFTITIEKMAMEGAPSVVVDYEDFRQHTMAENAMRFKSISSEDLQ